jgi:HAD superfamily hydrolase (TIGR01459 family)
MSIPLLPGLGILADRYDGFILDLWGVVHDGVAPFPGVIDALERLMAGSKRVVFLSNAPRRALQVEKRLAEIGVPRSLYHHLMSSGEEAWQHLARRDDPFYADLGRRCFHIGPERDHEMLDGLDLVKVPSPSEASFILNTGPWGWDETVASYEDRLRTGAEAGLPMVCANPDLVVMHGGRSVICAGSLAQRYEALGGIVRWHGKPHPSVYETCFGLLGIADRRRLLAVGDSLRTDIAGANGMGLDSVLIAGGIHGEEFGVSEHEIPDRTALDRAIATSGKVPTAVMTGLRW